MPLLSDYARNRKIRYFLEPIPKDARILEIGCGSGWVGQYLRSGGWKGYVGMDLLPPADVVGDIKNWRRLGLAPAGFDVIIAFEVVEHVDCFQECHDLLKPGGRLLITTPLPRMDWAMRALERFGLNQKRSSPHDHLVALRDVPRFPHKKVRIVAGLAQWGILEKQAV
jgi:2-polyprenyl-3-methyl-5-hydroxy-6-metoxy-1,4-benzoquinol methylase